MKYFPKKIEKIVDKTKATLARREIYLNILKKEFDSTRG
jgi:hypothetical protein